MSCTMMWTWCEYEVVWIRSSTALYFELCMVGVVAPVCIISYLTPGFSRSDLVVRSRTLYKVFGDRQCKNNLHKNELLSKVSSTRRIPYDDLLASHFLRESVTMRAVLTLPQWRSFVIVELLSLDYKKDWRISTENNCAGCRQVGEKKRFHMKDTHKRLDNQPCRAHLSMCAMEGHVHK